MPLVQVPFQKGQDSKIEAKVAPLGVLKTLANARMTKVSRVAKRPGAVAASLTGQTGSAVVSGSLPAQAVYKHQSGELFASLATGVDDAVYGVTAAGRRVLRGILSPWEAPELLLVQSAGSSCFEVSSAYANGYICTAFSSPTTAAAGLYVSVTDTNGRLRRFESLGTGTVVRKARVVACGNSFVVFWAENSSAERIRSSNFATGTAGASWSAVQNVTNGLTYLTGSYDFDVCAYSSTQVAMVYRKSSTELSVILWAFGAGTATGPTDVTADGVGLAIVGATGENISIGWRDASDGAVKINSFNGSLTSIAGPTTVDAGVAIGPVSLMRRSSTVNWIWWSETATQPTVLRRPFQSSDHTFTASAATMIRGAHLASKAALLSTGEPIVWCANTGTFQRNYVLVGFRTDDVDPRSLMVLARDKATAPADADHLSEIVSWTSSGIVNFAWGHPTIVDGTTEAGADIFRKPAVALSRQRGAARGQPAQAGDQLLIAGGVLAQFDGGLVAESGFILPPQLLTATQGTSGSLTQLGVYRYVLTARHYDASGNLTISQVSDPLTVTLTSTNDDVTLTWSEGAFLGFRRGSFEAAFDLTSGGEPRVDIWRTLESGSIFYRVSDADGIDIGTGTFLDTMADTDARDNPVLYTQGERGGLSGPLQNDTPPPCRFIWAGKDRVGCSGLEDPSEFQFSKLFFPGEAVHFSNHRSFRGRIPGRTGPIFCLDDVWAVFEATSGLYTVSGAGPDDTGQGGFDEPRRHSSEYGCNEWRSLCEAPPGLYFQGNDGQIHLLPRGFGPTVWASRNVKEVLETYPVVTSATLVPSEKTINWTVTTSDGASGRLLVYDYVNDVWDVDTIAGGVAHISGALWDGKLALATTSAIDVMTPGTYSDRSSTWYGVTIETHPLKPGGLLGDGRTRMIGVVAEYRGDCGLDMRIAVNDSQTFSSAHSFVDATTVLGQVAGDQVLRGWQIPFQKGGSYAVRLSETQDASTLTEGLAFVGIAFDYRPRRDAQGRPIAPVHR